MANTIQLHSYMQINPVICKLIQIFSHISRVMLFKKLFMMLLLRDDFSITEIDF